MLYLIGAGLYDHKDLTFRAKEALDSCKHIYLECYTSLLHVTLEEFEAFLGKPIILADRDFVENKVDILLEQAKEDNVALIVIGDVFGATTHTDLYLRATNAGIPVRIIHNASILTAVGEVGLELYKYGKTTSMVYFEQGFVPTTPYDVITLNKAQGLHTLVLLDIKADQGRFMTIAECIDQLEVLEEIRGEQQITPESFVIGCARLGSPDRKIVAGTISQIKRIDFGGPLHCLIFPGALHFIEEEALALWR